MNLTFQVATSVVNADLIKAMPDVPIRWTVPNPAPDKFIRVLRAGSAAAHRWQDAAAMDFHCYAGAAGDSPKAAGELAARVKSVLLSLPDRPNRVSKVTITGEADLPDATSSRPRVIVGAVVILRPL